jgi:hypothetical protein
MTTPRRQPAAAVGKDGRIYAIGGIDNLQGPWRQSRRSLPNRGGRLRDPAGGNVSEVCQYGRTRLPLRLSS